MVQDNLTETRSHYDRFLAGLYLWMAGGSDANLQENRNFFAGHDLVPQGTRMAIDLGAGCGFQSIPLAESGFSVAAIDSCRPLLEDLRERAGSMPVEIIPADILDFPAWSSRSPELVVCMGDTLTHLPDTVAVLRLIRQCHAELVPGGSLVLSLRDYSPDPAGSVRVIPVRRDADRIFLCRLEYRKDTVSVTDILFSRLPGRWERTGSSYTKIRIAPGALLEMLEGAGFATGFFESGDGVITVIAKKG
ncbi:MAG: class I SAM-dependent methyltransferase [Methanoregula sp.]